ncbi:MAG TPA: hypothetical protein VM890_06855 [Longimicrobium sp.]|nr:hypothetical protein [Longimicrobium sp.]
MTPPTLAAGMEAELLSRVAHPGPGGDAIPGLAEAKPAHARWAEANGDFLEYAASHPECLDRASYASMYGVEWIRKLRLQPWPLFVDGTRRRELEAVARGVDRLMKDTLGRFFLNDPAEVAAFYAADEPRADESFGTFTPDADVVAMLLEEPDGVDAAPSRGDYLETAEGLKLVEYNAGSGLGGLQADAVGDLCLAAAPTARFLAERGLRARPPGTLRAFFRHMIDDTVRSGAWPGGDLNLAMMVRPNTPERIALHSPALYEREYRRALEEGGLAGRVLLCGPGDLVEEDGFLAVDGHRLHALAEFYEGAVHPTSVPFRYFKMGRLNLFSGHIGWLLSDKRNLALLSTYADTDLFTDAERELIHRHIPWTRRVQRGGAGHGGRGIRVPDDLAARREELVLKKASSIGGRHVHVGKFRTDAEWARVIARALHDGDWIVQEYLEMVPYCFQQGARGAGRHDMVWGLFVFGGHFGGAFLRMQPVGDASGLVNTNHGAEVGVLLNLDE